MNRIVAVSPLVSRACTRGIATSQVRRVKPDLTAIKKQQEHYQANHEIPTYVRNGTSDKILLYVTTALTIFGVGASLEGAYRLSQK